MVDMQNMNEEQLKDKFKEFDCIVEGLQGLTAMQLMKKVGDVSKAIKMQHELTAALFIEYKTLNERLSQCLKKHPSDI